VSYSQSFADQLAELMGGAGKVTTKKMFGALGYYRGPTLFACLMDGDVFYFKAKSALADEMKAMGCKPFIYNGKSGRSVAMPYWTAPHACIDDADEMVKWVKKALAALAEDPSPVTKKPLGKKAATKKVVRKSK
jgi:DNA transformation protein and related proteins